MIEIKRKNKRIKLEDSIQGTLLNIYHDGETSLGISCCGQVSIRGDKVYAICIEDGRCYTDGDLPCTIIDDCELIYKRPENE